MNSPSEAYIQPPPGFHRLSAPGTGGTAEFTRQLHGALAEKRAVWVPAGWYRVDRPLRLRSGQRLCAHPDAVFRMEDGVLTGGEDCMIGNADPRGGNEGIEVRGGVWDGNNPGNPRGAMFSEGYSGALMDFRNVRGLVLSDLVLRDPEAFYIRLGEVREFRVERIRFEAAHVRPNQDGVHLGGGCEDGEIHGLKAVGKGVTGDDLLALNADDALNRVELRGLANAPIRRIRASGLEAEDCHTFVRILSIHSEIEDIDITGIRGGCGVACLNMDGARFCVVPLFDPEDPAYRNGVGSVRRIRLADVEVFSSRPGTNPLFHLMTRSEALEIVDFRRDIQNDCRPEVETVCCGHLPGSRLRLEGAGEDQEFLLKDSGILRLRVNGWRRLWLDGESAVDSEISAGCCR